MAAGLWDAAASLVSWAATKLGVIRMVPILLPPSHDRSWARAETIARALRAKGKSNPWIVAAVANAYAESGWRAVIAGDHGQSFGPWQLKFEFYGLPILGAVKVDIQTEADLARHVDAIVWLIDEWTVKGVRPLAKVSADLAAATTGADATRIWCAEFERASAPGAVERRVAIAPAIEAWLYRLG